MTQNKKFAMTMAYSLGLMAEMEMDTARHKNNIKSETSKRSQSTISKNERKKRTKHRKENKKLNLKRKGKK